MRVRESALKYPQEEAGTKAKVDTAPPLHLWETKTRKVWENKEVQEKQGKGLQPVPGCQVGSPLKSIDLAWTLWHFLHWVQLSSVQSLSLEQSKLVGVS